MPFNRVEPISVGLRRVANPYSGGIWQDFPAAIVYHEMSRCCCLQYQAVNP
jgi:hypothetical protein